MSVRHYSTDLTALPDWSTAAGVDAAATGMSADTPSLPVDPFTFSMQLNGATYTSNIAVAFEVRFVHQ